MAVYFIHTCAVKGCGKRLVNNERLKRYVHANAAPENEPHKPVVRSTRTEEKK